MTLAKLWTRGDLAHPLIQNFPDPNTPFHIGEQRPSEGGRNAVFTRIIVDYEIGVAIPSTSPPPEAWWSAAAFTICANWSLSTPGQMPAPHSAPTGLIFVTSLTPTLVASPSAPDEYYVLFKLKKTMDVSVQRSVPPEFDLTPNITVYGFYGDPYSALYGTSGYQHTINAKGFMSTLWAFPQLNP